MVIRAFYDSFKEELRKLAIEINGSIKDSESEFTYPSLYGKFKNKTADIELLWEVGATFLTIYVISDFGLELTIEKETTGSIIGKKFSMDKEVALDRTIVPESFNAQYLIKGKPEEEIKKFLSQQRAVREIEALEPFRRLTIKKTLIFSKHFVDSEDDFKASRLMQIIRSLHTLSELV